MDEFKSLVDTVEQLLGPSGCPWDREQTMQSIRHSLVEETYEVIEAINMNHPLFIKEEVGDLLFNAVLLCRLAEKEGYFNLKDALSALVEKLVRRHPHVFANVQLSSVDDVLTQWDHIKGIEKQGERTNPLDGIPKDLPALAKGQKMAKKLLKEGFESSLDAETFSEEEKIGDFLWKYIQSVSKKGIDVEQALRKRLSQIELEFREKEKN
ncbi:MAG: MazG family protein [Parachlamydiaceae bacterium]